MPPAPSRKDAAALASAVGEPKGAPAPAPKATPAPVQPARRQRVCAWVDDSQFNLASWMGGKLRATLEVFNIPDVGKCEVTFRELTGQEFREIDAMVARAVGERSIWSEGDVARFRNVAHTAAAIVAVNKKPWPEPRKKKGEEDGEPRQPSVEERTTILRTSMGQTMLDLYVKAASDFNDELIEMVRGVDPKLFASPSGTSEEPSPSVE